MFKRKRNRNKVNATGRNLYQRHIQLTHKLLETPAYRSLSPTARALLVELAMLYNGDNNGSLYLSVRDAAARLGLGSVKPAQEAFDELQALGFIALTQDAHFAVKTADHSRARAWRLNWQPGPGKRMADLELYERQPAPHTKARNRMERGLRALKTFRRGRESGYFPVADSDTLPPSKAPSFIKPVVDSATALTESRAFAANDRVSESGTHIDYHGGMGDADQQTDAQTTLDTIGGHRNGARLGWWQPDHSSQMKGWIYSAILAGQLGQAIGDKKLAA